MFAQKCLLSLLILLTACLKVLGQTNTVSGDNVLNFMPLGYEIMDSIKGDLNRDSIADMVLVLRTKAEAARLLPILLPLG